jgi:hypothetical protein
MSAAVRVQTPDEASVAAENEARAAAHAAAAEAAATAPARAEGEARVIQLPNNYEPSPRDKKPLMRQLLDDHAAGDLEPELVALGPLPVWASPQMRHIADDLRTRFGLLRREGVYRAVPYALSEAMRLDPVRSLSGASYALKQLCAEKVILHPGNLKPLGKRDGTKLYVPPCWWPADPAARAIFAETGRHDQAADLVWVPAEMLEDGGVA